jgi:hypothetical protein
VPSDQCGPARVGRAHVILIQGRAVRSTPWGCDRAEPPVSVFFVPVLSIAIEVVFAAVLVIAIGKTLRNMLRASSLLSS